MKETKMALKNINRSKMFPNKTKGKNQRKIVGLRRSKQEDMHGYECNVDIFSDRSNTVIAAVAIETRVSNLFLMLRYQSVPIHLSPPVFRTCVLNDANNKNGSILLLINFPLLLHIKRTYAHVLITV